MGDLKLTSASGSVTLSPENVAGTTTITVPSSTATLLTTSLSNLSATGEQKVAQAWVNFNGTGTPSIGDSYNVSSITDNGTGDYTVNFTNNMGNAYYSAVGNSSPWNTGDDEYRVVGVSDLTTSSLRVTSLEPYLNGSSADLRAIDHNLCCIQIFGDPS